MMFPSLFHSFTLAATLLVLVVSNTDAFLIPLIPTRSRPTVAPTGSVPTILFSTLSPTQNDISGLSDDYDDDETNENENLQLITTNEMTTDTNINKKGGLSMTLDELATHLDGYGRARLAWDCYSIGVDPALFFSSGVSLGWDDFETIYNLLPTQRRRQTLGKEALARLGELYSNYAISNADSDDEAGGRVEGGVASLSHVSQAHDETTKLLLRLSDGLEIETVIIPWNGTRSTLCVSSQVGCRQGTLSNRAFIWLLLPSLLGSSKAKPANTLDFIYFFYSLCYCTNCCSGCRFCATGKMGKLRSLTSDEILSQMFFARKICRLNSLPPVTNVVFMGMGDAADTADAVRTAVAILTDRQLFQMSAQKVTVSTIAPTPDAFQQFTELRCVLAWSVHAANDNLRRQLVPSTKFSMVELRQGLIDTLLQRPKHLRATMLEVALLASVNDSEKEADELAEFASVIIQNVPECKLIVNLIPYNEIGDVQGQQYKKPSNEAVVNFQKRLWNQGIHAHARTTRGDDATAACGQLATTSKNKMKKQLLQVQVNDTISTSDNHLQ